MRHIVSALREFVGRYGEAFQAAWSIRETFETKKRSKDELAFLPAHLELIETPVSPAPRWIIRSIIAFFCVSFLWSILAKLDVVAIAPGKMVAGSRTKVVQSAENSVVKRILVRDGQSVHEGDLLIELDGTGAAADHDKAEETLIAARLAEIRLQALAVALQAGKLPRLAPSDDVPSKRLDTEQVLAASEFEVYRTKRENIGATIVQRQAELATVRGLIDPLVESAAIATARASDYAKLVEGRYVGRHEYMLREQERIAAESEVAAQRSRLVEVRSALHVAMEEQQVLEAGMFQQTLDALRQAREQAQQAKPDVLRTERRNRLMQLRAPVTGTVQQLAIHTVGGVVSAGQPILYVVPSDDSLEVEVAILNKDAGFVRPGQRATIKIESFPYTRFGYLEGVVRSVSHDAAQDEKLGFVFPALIRIERPTLVVDGVRMSLTPGMTLTTEIKIGRRRAISYLLSPLQRSGSEAMRER